MRHLYILPVLGLLLIFTSSCKEAEGQVIQIDASSELSYRFNQPDARFMLNSSLSEISGLAYDSETATLLAINDEKGNVYQINPADGSSHKTYDFGKTGDYEGIAIRDDKVYILKSNGHLYRYHTKKETTKEKKTILSQKHDCEGLAYDLDQHQLLIACKGQNLEGTSKQKMIYAYDLKSDEILPEPALSIDIKQLSSALTDKNASADLLYRIKRFSPSGIAIGPHQQRYVLSARGSSMLVFRQQILQQVVFFNIKDLPQPEGICFDTQMNLYIASEDKNGNGRLLKFNYQE